ncbi:hypothetical protein FQI71_26485 [Escherichia coli]|nr:hypothetical protein [Escherichia coli]
MVIPADAGNSYPVFAGGPRRSVYPRWCGELSKHNLLLINYFLRQSQSTNFTDAPRDKCTLSCAINGIHAAFHYLKKNYISGCVMTVPTG